MKASFAVGQTKRKIDDKEIAVKIRGNSHYRNFRHKDGSSRNAYRSAARKGLLGKWGDAVQTAYGST